MDSRRTTDRPTGQPSAAPGRRALEVLSIAESLFEQRGYAATTMGDIAAATGVLPGSLYHHFASKEDIAINILGLLEQDLETLAASEARRDTAGEDPREAIVRFAAQVIDVSLRHAAAIRLISYEAPTVATARLRRALQPSTGPLHRHWRRLCERLEASGSIDSGDLSLLQFCLRTLSLHAPVAYVRGQSADRLAELLCRSVLDGIAIDCPRDAVLQGSPAALAANAAMASWPRYVPGTGDPTDRAEIIAAARREFARRGYHATTVRDIAEAAGVRMGTLYRRVESKEEMLDHIMREYSDAMGAAIVSALETGDSAVESIDAYVQVFVRGRRHFNLEMNISKLGSSDRDTPGSPFHRHYRQTSARRRLLESVLRSGIEDGTIAPLGSATEMADQVRSIAWLPYHEFSRTSEKRALSFLRRAMLRGLVPSTSGLRG